MISAITSLAIIQGLDKGVEHKELCSWSTQSQEISQALFEMIFHQLQDRYSTRGPFHPVYGILAKTALRVFFKSFYGGKTEIFHSFRPKTPNRV